MGISYEPQGVAGYFCSLEGENGLSVKVIQTPRTHTANCITKRRTGRRGCRGQQLGPPSSATRRAPHRFGRHRPEHPARSPRPEGAAMFGSMAVDMVPGLAAPPQAAA